MDTLLILNRCMTNHCQRCQPPIQPIQSRAVVGQPNRGLPLDGANPTNNEADIGWIGLFATLVCIERDRLPFCYTVLTDPFLLFRVHLQLDIEAKTPDPRCEDSRSRRLRVPEEFGPRKVLPRLGIGLQEGRQRRIFRSFGKTIFFLELRAFCSRIHICCS